MPLFRWQEQFLRKANKRAPLVVNSLLVPRASAYIPVSTIYALPKDYSVFGFATIRDPKTSNKFESNNRGMMKRLWLVE